MRSAYPRERLAHPILALLLGTAVYAIAEEITLTTYYPSPRGVYQELKTAGDLVVGDITNPPAARLHVVGSGSTPSLRVDKSPIDATSPVVIDQTGNVGIGTASPTAKLEIAGNVKIADGTQGTGKVLTSDATGMASWQQAVIPSGAVMFFHLASCPTGWTELTAAQGRYLVGYTGAGSPGDPVGTALGPLENRPAGEHSHHGMWTNYYPGLSGRVTSTATGFTFSIGSTGGAGQQLITSPVLDVPAGTAAPYLQLLVCQKT